MRKELRERARILRADIYFPWIVCLCGSTRFMMAFREANEKLTLEGKIVLSVGLAARDMTEEDKVRMDDLHFCKIDLADEVLILNVGGYIGESTSRELAYARKQGKVINFLEAPP